MNRNYSLLYTRFRTKLRAPQSMFALLKQQLVKPSWLEAHEGFAVQQLSSVQPSNGCVGVEGCMAQNAAVSFGHS
jgi:hypothetical protein